MQGGENSFYKQSEKIEELWPRKGQKLETLKNIVLV
jgi:hypothetical protein